MSLTTSAVFECPNGELTQNFLKTKPGIRSNPPPAKLTSYRKYDKLFTKVCQNIEWSL